MNLSITTAVVWGLVRMIVTALLISGAMAFILFF